MNSLEAFVLFFFVLPAVLWSFKAVFHQNQHSARALTILRPFLFAMCCCVHASNLMTTDSLGLLKFLELWYSGIKVAEFFDLPRCSPSCNNSPQSKLLQPLLYKLTSGQISLVNCSHLPASTFFLGNLSTLVQQKSLLLRELNISSLLSSHLLTKRYIWFWRNSVRPCCFE